MQAKLCVILLALLLAACKAETTPASKLEATQTAKPLPTSAPNSAVEEAYKRKLSHVWVEGQGRVHKLLPDDNKGARHQKFLVKISDDKTLLFAHNIDLAPRIEGLQVGDEISFRGEYVYNPKGGVVHWTHHNPEGGNKFGWIKYKGKTYE